MVVMATPDMQAALLRELGACPLSDWSGFQNASITLLRYLLSEICRRTLLLLLQGFWCLLISDGDAATPVILKGAKTLYWPASFRLALVRSMDEAASVKDNMGNFVEIWKGIVNWHYYLEGVSGGLPVPLNSVFQHVDCKSADRKLSKESYSCSTCRPEDNQKHVVLGISSRTRPFSNGMEEENDLTERCKVRSDGFIEGLNSVDTVPRRQTASWIVAAKNKDDDEDEEDDDEEDEDEDDSAEDEDDDGEGGDDEEDDDGGNGGDDRDGDKDGEDDDAEDDEEGDYEEDEDDEDVDEESSDDEDETPPKKMRK